ncbi:protein kinase C and casein kinase substrate in neurons protein 1-like isoform X2 [Anneissia japonica]|uniref:protein kinase C and casein kinase substrate in neurons protein 1-like isoform X2 n=1 Tax=Anneissia japonica TaxID=1529436 RepID=UPI0014259998|nr:protein kinase C and casein kinase substrate in neurons protein 1-like isoform X2 [Anneissia japonica]
MSEQGYDDQIIEDGKSFWELGQYKRTVKRIDDGHRLCNDLVMMLNERSELEKKYAKSLRNWSKKWNDLIEKGSEYGTTKSAWKAVLTEADRKCDLHLEIGSKLIQDVQSSIKAWQKENYHKKMMNGFKETIEADEAFRKAQKPWAKLYNRVQQTKKAYHVACKQEHSAANLEKNALEDTTMSPDQVKKLQDKVEKCRHECEKTKDKYSKALEDITDMNARYMEDMNTHFDKTQHFEKNRLDFFKETLIHLHRVLDLSQNAQFAEVYSNFITTVQNADSDKDLKWWKNTNGSGMPMNWPTFEEYSEDLSRMISSKKSRGNVGGGEKAVAISSFRSTSEYSNQDYNTMDRNYGDVEHQVYSSYSTQSGYSGEHDAYNNYGSDQDGGNPFGDDEMNGDGVEVRALYDYQGAESDELTFNQGDIITKLEDEDEQGWCKGRINGVVGLYPASYGEAIN